MRIRNDAILDDMAVGPPSGRATAQALPFVSSRRTEHSPDYINRIGAGQPYDPYGSRRTTQRSHNGRNRCARILIPVITACAHQALVFVENKGEGIFVRASRGGMGFYKGFGGESGEEREGLGSGGVREREESS